MHQQGRDPDSAREGHRHRPVPLPRVCDQPGMADRDLDRRRPHRLAPAAGPAREAARMRAESAAVPVAARPGPPDPRRATTPATVPGHLALGHRHPHRVHRDPRPHPATDLRLTPLTRPPTSEHHPETRPAAPRGTPPRPKRETRRQRKRLAVTDPGVGSGAGAVRQCLRPVSSPRPSNRACGSPAHGSPTSFTARHSA